MSLIAAAGALAPWYIRWPLALLGGVGRGLRAAARWAGEHPLLALCIAEAALIGWLLLLTVPGLRADLARARTELAGERAAGAAAARRIGRASARITARIVTIEEENDRAKTDLARQRDAALASLRERPARPVRRGNEDRADPPSCPGATGAGLYREDGEFLVREAARADLIRAELKACYAQFDAVADEINAAMEDAGAVSLAPHPGVQRSSRASISTRLKIDSAPSSAASM